MTRKIVLFVVFVLVVDKLQAQNLLTGIQSDSINVLRTNTKIENYLEHEQKITCEEQLFIQTDKNKYRPGDTIYFQAYVRNVFTGSFESSSTSMYTLLFNDQHQLSDSSRFRILNATSPGWLTLPPDAKPGMYHFIAFTSLMQNFDPIDAFHLDLKVDAPQNQRMNSYKQERFQVKNFSFPFSDDYIDLRFLPEGGNFTIGLQQLIAFNAVDRYGETFRVEGFLKNANGHILDTVRSGPFGPGKFLCRSEKGLFLELTDFPGKQKIWPLPDPDTSGFCLSIIPAGRRSFAIEVQSDSYKGDTLIVSGAMAMKQIFDKELIMDRKQRLVIKTDDLPEGIVEVTLFSKDLKPVAERLVSVNADEHLQFSVKTDKPDYSPGQEAELTVNVTDPAGKPASGFFSVSVIDSLSGHDPSIFIPGIAFALNYNPVFPSNLPSAVLTKGFENLPEDQRDLILMTYGWCRFNWNFDRSSSNIKEPVDYDQLKMKLLYSSQGHLADRKLDLVSLEGPSIMHLKTNKVGEISLPLASLPDITRSVTIMPDTKSSDKVSGVMLSIPYNEQFMKNKNLFISQNSITRVKSVETTLLRKPGLTEKIIELPEVSVSASRKTEYLNQYEEVYKYANVKNMPGERIKECQTLGQAIRNIVPTATIGEPPDPAVIYFRQSHSFFGGNVKVLIVLDGMRLDNGWELDYVRNLPTDQISSISILDGPQGHTIYGEEASGGVIFINTNKAGFTNIRTDWKMQNKSNNMLVPINLYRPNIEFYNPVRAEIESDPAFNGRATIYWNPEVYFDGKNPVHIKYVNPLRSTSLLININGVSLDNLVGTTKVSYRVNKIQ